MSLSVTNVIPPNVPSARKVNVGFKGGNESVKISQQPKVMNNNVNYDSFCKNYK